MNTSATRTRASWWIHSASVSPTSSPTPRSTPPCPPTAPTPIVAGREGALFELDLGAATQTNIDTQVSRNVRRVYEGGAAAEESDEEGSAEEEVEETEDQMVARAIAASMAGHSPAPSSKKRPAPSSDEGEDEDEDGDDGGGGGGENDGLTGNTFCITVTMFDMIDDPRPSPVTADPSPLAPRPLP